MAMYAPGTVAFLVTIVLIWTLRPLAARARLAEKPTDRTRISGDIPVVGGIAMFLGIAAGTFVGDLMPGSLYIVGGCGLIVLVGTIDDRCCLPVSMRIVAQAGAVLVMILGAGAMLRDIGDPFWIGTIRLHGAAVPLTMIVALTVINAFNFIDGIDGLAASIAIVALLAGAIASATPFAIIVCGAILGFLVFNFPVAHNRRVRTFMGDAGSTLLGLSVVWCTLGIVNGEGHSVSPVVALWFALIPLADFFFCIVRRLLDGRSPFQGGKEHFHYALLRRGLSERQALAVLVSLAAIYAVTGLIGMALGAPDAAMFLPWIVLLACQRFVIELCARLLKRFRSTEVAAVSDSGFTTERLTKEPLIH